MLFGKKQKKSERVVEHEATLQQLEQIAKVAVCARRGMCDGCSMARTCARRISKEGRL